MTPIRGITVLGDYILSEGVDEILANITRIGANAVACNPTVTAPTNEGEGTLQPPSDGGQSPRRFDRPLFGKDEVWVRSGPSYEPCVEFYADSPYGPRQGNDLTQAHGKQIERFINGALERGIRVYLQVPSCEPPRLRDEDRPRMPDGSLPPGRVADTGSLASPAIRAYNGALVHDLWAAYPQITGLRIDWPEYPCYTPGEVLQDFGPHVERWAVGQGHAFDEVRTKVDAFVQFLRTGLTNDHLHQFESASLDECLDRTLRNRGNDTARAIGRWLGWKAQLSTDLVRDWRDALNQAGAAHWELTAHAFMPPFSRVTGLDFGAVASHCDCLAPKLFTMHWSLMVQLWSKFLLEGNPQLDEQLVVPVIVALMDLSAPEAGGDTLADYGYSLPDQPHPIPDEPQRRKIDQAIAAAKSQGATTRVCPKVHGYGPLGDFSRRLQLAVASDADGVWVNRYGYLSDEKLETILSVWALKD